MDKLKKLMARCKCGVYLAVNEHRDYYDTPARNGSKNWIAAHARQRSAMRCALAF